MKKPVKLHSGHWQLFYTLNIILIILPSGWFNGGKGNTNSTAYLFLIMIGITFLFEKKARALLLFILGLTVAVLFYIEYMFPSLLKTYSEELMFRDRLIQLPLTLTAGYLLLRQFANTYIEEQHKLNLYSRRLQEANKKLESLANKDTLTDIYNRRAFDIRLREIIHSKEQLEKEIYIILFDIDLFKEINDNHGHNAGDNVLCSVAEKFISILSERDFFSRWGGDEFAIIYYGKQEEVIRTVELFNQKLLEIELPGKHRVTISMGVTLVKASDCVNEVFKRVDDGLYKSKENGRNQYTFV
jgi:diguanylate cyclase (GGDEF)-like protein